MYTIEKLLSLLSCPECHNDSLAFNEKSNQLICKKCKTSWPIVNQRPVLLRPGNELFNIQDYMNISPTKTLNQSGNKFSALIPGLSVNMSSARIMTQISEKFKIKKSAKILIVGGGTQRGWLSKYFESCNSTDLIYSDIDINADVDLFCDGHDLPFKDNSFDAVITTAVLEHVLYPERVAGEIMRVLKSDGLLYSELPFMQQVHEGAYDFTRYTLSGHRRLFSQVSEIESGMVAGPATALSWAIENFFLAFSRRTVIRKFMKLVIRIIFFWLKYFDYLLAKKKQAMDGASCTFLYGQKKNRKIPDSQIISGYVGAKHISHT